MAIERGNWQIQIGPDPVAGLLASYVEGVQAMPVEGGPLVQEESLALGTVKQYFDRGNFSAVRNFVITKEFPDNQQSYDFYLIGVLNFNGVKDVKLTRRDYTGTETKYKISAANVKLSIEEPIGVTCTIKLTVTGGKAVLQP